MVSVFRFWPDLELGDGGVDVNVVIVGSVLSVDEGGCSKDDGGDGEIGDCSVDVLGSVSGNVEVCSDVGVRCDIFHVGGCFGLVD